MSNEKALTIKQPYAYLICAGIKDIENRTWKCPQKYIGKRVYIHASAKRVGKSPIDGLTAEQYNYLCSIHEVHTISHVATSAIIGHIDIIDCVENHSSIWALPNHYHWVLANPVLFDKPIKNVKGRLSFWDCSEYITYAMSESRKEGKLLSNEDIDSIIYSELDNKI